jgi:hypothetical protein
MICKIKIVCKIQRGCPASVETCKNLTCFSSFLFCSWRLLFLQSCNWCNPMCLQRDASRDKGRSSIFLLAFPVNFVDYLLLKYLFQNWRRNVPPWPPVWSKYLEIMRTPVNFWMELPVLKKGIGNQCWSWCKTELWDAPNYHYLTFPTSTPTSNSPWALMLAGCT